MSYKISDAGAAGKGLFSTRKIKPGQAIFSLPRPLVTSLDTPAFDFTCEWCFNGNGEAAVGQVPLDTQATTMDNVEVKLLRCTGCRLVKYCSKSCQSQAWKHHHKLECKVFASFMPKVLPPASRMIIQLMLRKQKGLLSEQEWAQFIALQHHIRFFKETPPEKGDSKRLQMGALATKQYCGLTDSLEEIETWFARLYVNAQTLVSPIFHPLGQCLDPLSSMMNHSCMPNSAITFDGPRMTLRATSEIENGGEITISYIDPTPIAAVRQWELGEKYFFKCACSACTENSYCGQPDPPLSFRQSKNDFEVLNSLAKLDEAGLECQEQAKAADPDSEERWLSICAGLSIYLQQDNIDYYPAGRQPFAWLRFEAMVELLSRGEWVPALILLLQTYYDADPIHFPYQSHPVRVVHTYTLSKLAHHIHALQYAPDRVVESISREFGMEHKWADVSFALLGECIHCLDDSHGVESRLRHQALIEGATLRQNTRATTLIEGQNPEYFGIRDEKKWKGTASIARKGWKWYRDWMHRYVVVERCDAGLQILLQKKKAATPRLLRP